MSNDTVIRDCAMIVGRGSWETRGGGIGENHDEREGLDVKFYKFGGGHYFFYSLL